MPEYTLSASIRDTSPAALSDALARLTPSVRKHHDIDFEWCAPDMDLNFEAVTTSTRGSLEYLVSGYFTCPQDEALRRCLQLADALQHADIVYRIELDDEEADNNLLTQAHPGFPPYNAAEPH